MQIEKRTPNDLLIPRKILECAGISERIQIIVKSGELRIVPYIRKSVTKEIKGLGKSIQPRESSVELVRELRAEWKISE